MNEPSERPLAPREKGVLFVAAILAVMWLQEIFDQVFDGDLDRFGIRPRAVDGLDGVVLAPFLHDGFGHLFANSVPLLVLGVAIALTGLARIVAVTAITAAVGGAGTWLVAPADTNHLGASGLVFGFAAYLMARGFYSRRASHLVVGVLVLIVYGGGLIGGLVPTEGVSWQGHLFGALGGIVAARALEPGSRAPVSAR